MPKRAAGLSPAELQSYDICWSPDIGQAYLLTQQMEADRSDIPSRKPIVELLRNVIERRRFKSEDTALLRTTAVEIANGLGGEEAPKWFKSLICLLRLLETHSPDLQRAIALENYLAKALLDLDIFLNQWKQLKQNKLYFIGNSLADPTTDLPTHIREAQKYAASLIVDLQSCDCAEKIRESLDYLHNKLHELERCWCVLLCELKGQIYRDVSIAEAEARLIEVTYYTRFAQRLSFEITGTPRSVQHDLEALQSTVAQLIEDSKDFPKVQPLLENIRSSAQQLQPGNLQTELPPLMEMVRKAKCTSEIDAFPVLAALIQLECRCQRPVSVSEERLEDALITILKLLLSDKPLTRLTDTQRKSMAVVAHAIQNKSVTSSTSASGTAESGFDLTYPELVVRVVGRDQSTGETFELPVINGKALVRYRVGGQVAFTAFDALGNPLDQVLLTAGY